MCCFVANTLRRSLFECMCCSRILCNYELYAASRGPANYLQSRLCSELCDSERLAANDHFKPSVTVASPPFRDFHFK